MALPSDTNDDCNDGVLCEYANWLLDASDRLESLLQTLDHEEQVRITKKMSERFMEIVRQTEEEVQQITKRAV